MKPIFGAAIAAIVCAGFGAVLLWPTSLKCDDKNVLATVESLVRDKLSWSYSSLKFLLTKGGSSEDWESIRHMQLKGEIPHLAFDSFRERGAEGKGVRCAAIARFLLNGKPTFEFSAEYSVEPTTDGKIMVSARFMPN
ncbi:hypothetical protein ACVIGB_010286 [Bradyrhizobium sp. USDA 4341]